MFSRRHLLLSYAMGGFGLGINAMMLFLVPLRAAELGIGVGTIGLLLGTKAVVEAFASMPVGGFIDRRGARWVFVAGTGMTAVLGVVYALTSSVALLFVLQATLGLLRPTGWVGAQTYVSGLRTGAERAHDTGRLSFVATSSQIVAPLLVGGAAQLWSVQAGFFVFAAYASIFFVVGLLLPPERRARPTTDERAGFREGVGLLRIRGIRTVMLLTFVRVWAPNVWIGFFPLLLVQGGMAEGLAGSVVSAMALVASGVSLLAGRLARLGRLEYVTTGGLACSAAALALSPFVAVFPFAYLPAGLLGIGMGLSLPLLIALVGKAAPAERRGLALGLRAAVNQTAAALAPVVAGSLIAATGATLGFPVAAVLAAGVLTAAVASTRRDPEEGTAEVDS